MGTKYKDKTKDTTLTIRITDDTRREIEELSRRLDQTMSKTARDIITRRIAELRKGQI